VGDHPPLSWSTSVLRSFALAIGWAGVANHHNIHGWSAWLGGVGVHLVFAVLGAGSVVRYSHHRSCTDRARLY